MTRLGRQTPTVSSILPYDDTRGAEAISIYNKTSRKARQWQELLIYDILAVNEEGLWTHERFGYEIPRRNGKGEILAIREMYGLMNGEQILHTAHRATTSHSAWERLVKLMGETGVEIKSTKQFGLETIRVESTGGRISFRTRTNSGGLGEGFDLLVIDEAQDYTTDQESTLKYTVTDSQNPQTLLCGTPPTAVSVGTVFVHMREKVFNGGAKYTGWAEWSVPYQEDPENRDLWYECNPSLGCGLTERAVEAEVGSDVIDFNIQRLGLWLQYNQKSAISKKEWESLAVNTLPQFSGKLYAAIKFGVDGEHVALSIACKTTDEKVFVEAIDCRKIKDGNAWICDFLKRATQVDTVAIDGAGGQQILKEDLEDVGVKCKIILPRVQEIRDANQNFELSIAGKTITHMNQPSLTQSVSNCEKRPLGSNGGFGYRSIKKDVDVVLTESISLACWLCSRTKPKKAQVARY